MSEIDRIHRIAPTIQAPAATQHVNVSGWQGGQNQEYQPPEDKVELHEVEEEEAIEDAPASSDLDDDQGLDIAV